MRLAFSYTVNHPNAANACTVSKPLIPAIHIPAFQLIGERHSLELLGHTFSIGPLSIAPFGVLVALGVYVGGLVAMRIGRKRGIPGPLMARYMFWVLATAFACGHVLDAIFYHPARVMHYPWTLLRLWDGMSSFGGFIGAALGTFLFKWRYKTPVLPFADTMAAAFPVGWTLGRAGCAIVHDHKGMPSDLWFAVAFKDGGRFDLGLYEMVFAFVMAIVCLHLARKPKPPGFFLGFTMLAYAPVRFCMDFLRARPGDGPTADMRYFDLTPAQWASFAMVAAGFWLLYRAANSNEVGNEPYIKAAKAAAKAVDEDNDSSNDENDIPSVPANSPDNAT